MKRLLSISSALAVLVACGGATRTNLEAPADGGADGGDAGADGAPKPRFEDLVTCTKPGTCELGAKGCCGLNCQADSAIVAIRRGESSNVVAATCDEPGPIACPACARRVDGNLQPFCTGGKCAVVDLRTDALSSCDKDEDCVLRYGTCCQSCSGGLIDQIVAIKKGNEPALDAQMCEGSEGCDKCLPVFPPGVRVRCSPSSKHCEVVK